MQEEQEEVQEEVHGVVPAAVRRMAAVRRTAAVRRLWMGVGSGVDLALLLAEPPRNT